MNKEPGGSFHTFSSSQGETALSLWCKSAFSSLLPLSNLGGIENEEKKMTFNARWELQTLPGSLA